MVLTTVAGIAGCGFHPNPRTPMTMTPDTTASLDSGSSSADVVVRLPYEAPELVDQGDVTEQTKSGATGAGTDAGYS